MYNYHDLFNYILNLIKKREKKIKNISARFMFPHINMNNIRYKKELGGGSFYDCGCYLFKFFSSFVNYEEQIKRNLKFIHQKNFEVDTYGRLIAKKKHIKIKLEWGIGYKYFNQIIINFDNKKIIANRFFSKNINENSKIIEFFKNTKKNKFINFKKQNHFKSMFLFYINMLQSKKRRNNYYKELENYQKMYLTELPYKL